MSSPWQVCCVLYVLGGSRKKRQAFPSVVTRTTASLVSMRCQRHDRLSPHTFITEAPRLEERWCTCRGAPAGVHRGVPASLARQVLCDTSWQERAPPPPETAQAGSGESASAAAAAMASADAFAPDQLTCPSPNAHTHTGRTALS